ncbi:hypothetical protein QJQ45_009788 [Haematococcus lacustris]|nr:hypothetical protein QJQ45_009788 [Haematococcus lacustris]
MSLKRNRKRPVSPAPSAAGASGSGQQDQGQGQAAIIGQRRRVIKAGLRGLVEAALPDLSPAQVVNGMKWVSRHYYHQERGVAVFLGAGNFSQGGWKAGAMRAGFLKVVEQPSRPGLARPDRLVIVDEFRTSRFSSWLDRDTNPCLNFQRTGESMQRPLELCSYEGLMALPPIGKEYQQGYKRVNDRLPKVKRRLHRAAEYRRGIDGRARNNA